MKNAMKFMKIAVDVGKRCPDLGMETCVKQVAH